MTKKITKRKYTRRTHIDEAGVDQTVQSNVSDTQDVNQETEDSEHLVFKQTIRHNGVIYREGESADTLSSNLKERFKIEGIL